MQAAQEAWGAMSATRDSAQIRLSWRLLVVAAPSTSVCWRLLLPGRPTAAAGRTSWQRCSRSAFCENFSARTWSPARSAARQMSRHLNASSLLALPPTLLLLIVPPLLLLRACGGCARVRQWQVA